MQRRRHEQHRRAGMLTAALAVVLIASGIPLGGALLNRWDGDTATDPTPSVSTEAPSTSAPSPASTAPRSSAVAPRPRSRFPRLPPWLPCWARTGSAR